MLVRIVVITLVTAQELYPWNYLFNKKVNCYGQIDK